MTLTMASPARSLGCAARVALLFAATLLAGCNSAHYPVNEPLGHKDAKEAYSLQRVAADPANPGDVLVVVSFSGGGTRAAALAYGTLEALRDVTLPIGGTKRRLLDEVDIINAVSGGSVVAAYYALHHDDTFRDFEDRFLHRDVERDLKRMVASNMRRLASKHFGRTDLLAEYFDDLLFEGKTFDDLAHGAYRPFVVINAADLSTGARFPFTQGQFDLLCSDLAHVRVARAVAASAALPPYFTAITLQNYAGTCDVRPPAGLAAAPRDGAAGSRDLARLREARSYQDRGRRPFIHLVDGGLIDNLGVRGTIDFAVENGGFLELVDALGYHDVTHAVFISVNAQRAPDLAIDQSDEIPSFRRVMRAFELPVNAQSIHISDQLRASFERWRDEIDRRRPSAPDAAHASPRFYFIDVSLQAIPDEAERDYFKQIPTTLTLDAPTVDRLRAVARKLLLDSPDFQQLVKDLGG